MPTLCLAACPACSHEEWEAGSEIQPAAYAASVSLEPTSSRRERQPGERLQT
jgi:hypothetical protein